MAYVRNKYNVPYHLRQKHIPKVKCQTFYIGGPLRGLRRGPLPVPVRYFP